MSQMNQPGRKNRIVRNRNLRTKSFGKKTTLNPDLNDYYQME